MRLVHPSLSQALQPDLCVVLGHSLQFGLDEENLSKEEMSDLLKALKNSTDKQEVECVVVTDTNVHTNEGESEACTSTPKRSMKRRYLNVRDRRMPWGLLPPTITQAEKARTLAVYIKLMSINNYRQARQSAKFEAWPPPIKIAEETARIQPLRSTRSGRSVPVYVDFDDDSSDLDFVVTKSKKRKTSTSEHNGNDGNLANKTLSLKRKPAKEENNRPVKEPKLNSDKLEVVSTSIHVKPKRDLFSIIED